MSKEFVKLVKLEHERAITVGLDRNHANNFWYRTTRIGKPLNILTIVFIISTIYLFFSSGFKIGILAFIFTGAYTILIQKIAGWHVRSRLLRDEELFDAAYEARSITIRNNEDREIIYFPTNWRLWIKNKSRP